MDSRYPDDWASRSRQVKKRDNHTCQNCGVKGGPKGNTELHAHHIVPISDGGSHKKSNLKTLCKDCHDAIHHNDKVAPTGGSKSGFDYDSDDISLLRGIPKFFGGVLLLGGIMIAFMWPIMFVGGILASVIDFFYLIDVVSTNSFLFEPENADSPPLEQELGTEWGHFLENLFLSVFAFPLGMIGTYIGLVFWNLGCIGQSDEKKLGYSESDFPIKYYWWWIDKFSQIMEQKFDIQLRAQQSSEETE